MFHSYVSLPEEKMDWIFLFHHRWWMDHDEPLKLMRKNWMWKTKNPTENHRVVSFIAQNATADLGNGDSTIGNS